MSIRISLWPQIEQAIRYLLDKLPNAVGESTEVLCNTTSITPAGLAQREQEANAWVRQLVVKTKHL
jgi:hypothetical protein